MKKYSSNRAQKGKTAYRTPSRFKAQVRGTKDGFAFGKNFEQKGKVSKRWGKEGNLPIFSAKGGSTLGG